MRCGPRSLVAIGCLVIVSACPAAGLPAVRMGADADQDGVPDSQDTCPTVEYEPRFDWQGCDPQDEDPANDAEFECRTRERIVQTLLSSGVFVTHIAFAVVTSGTVHFADAFSYVGQGQYVHDPEGIHRLYRIGSTTKSVTAVAAKILEESGVLSLGDLVNDEDATPGPGSGERTLGQLLSHQGAFALDSGALHLFCYPGDLAAFWAEGDDAVSPHYDSATYGNLGGGFQYSAFNYSLAGAYLANREGKPFADVLQTRVFDPAGMCTAMFDGARGAGTPIGGDPGVSQGAVMHVGPYINLVSPTDPRCEDNFYSSEDLPGDPYSFQSYRLDEADAQARDPAGGVIASVIDMGHFAEALLASYHGQGSWLSASGIADLWGAVSDLGCSPNCPYEPSYGIGFFTDSAPGGPIAQVGHGGSRAGFASAFVLRPEADLAVAVLANADVSTVALSDLAKTILDDAETVVGAALEQKGMPPALALITPNPLTARKTAAIRFSLPVTARVELDVYDVRGRLVRNLSSRRYPPGDHAISWRPADDAVAPGAYFVRLVLAGSTSVRKIVVLP